MHPLPARFAFLGRMLARLLARADVDQVLVMLQTLLRRWVIGRDPVEALRLLLRLDTCVYELTGSQSIAYDGGTHTKHRHTRYHDFFIGNVSPGERVLDVGCGMGVLAFDLARRAGAIVTAVDVNEKALATARQRFTHPGVTWVCADATAFQPAGLIDVVVLSNVLEHLDERPAFLRQLLCRVAPRRLLIRVPVFERDWRVPLKRELDLEWRLDKTHRIEYTRETFAEEMTAAGLCLTHREVRWGEIWAIAIPRQEDTRV